MCNFNKNIQRGPRDIKKSVGVVNNCNKKLANNCNNEIYSNTENSLVDLLGSI